MDDLGRSLGIGNGTRQHLDGALGEHLLRGMAQTNHVVIPVSPYPQTISEDVTPTDQGIAGV